MGDLLYLTTRPFLSLTAREFKLPFCAYKRTLQVWFPVSDMPPSNFKHSAQRYTGASCAIGRGGFFNLRCALCRLMQTLLRDSEAGGAHVALSCQVVGGDLKGEYNIMSGVEEPSIAQAPLLMMNLCLTVSSGIVGSSVWVGQSRFKTNIKTPPPQRGTKAVCITGPPDVQGHRSGWRCGTSKAAKPAQCLPVTW